MCPVHGLPSEVAQGRDVDTRLRGDVDEISAFFGGYGDSVDLDAEWSCRTPVTEFGPCLAVTGECGIDIE